MKNHLDRSEEKSNCGGIQKGKSKPIGDVSHNSFPYANDLL